MNLTKLSDEQLLQLVAGRDVEAFETLYERHAPVIYNLILRIVREPRTAEELVQESFWQVWQKAGDFRGTGAGAAWLYRIARNRALDRLRQHSARPQTLTWEPEEQAPLMDRYAQVPSVETTVEQRWQQQQVRQSLAAIPEEQRVILELAYFEGMTQSEIAEHLALPIGTIKSRIRLGVEKLERLLASTGLGRGDQ
ncbi:MAG: sigma-70 family RNA polymerase sigma factor [Caldilineaceae bacterium]|nr:sigma-70 family RNA polymerase sigma factor [Caldilineaceae bacterium]